MGRGRAREDTARIPFGQTFCPAGFLSDSVRIPFGFLSDTVTFTLLFYLDRTIVKVKVIMDLVAVLLSFKKADSDESLYMMFRSIYATANSCNTFVRNETIGQELLCKADATDVQPGAKTRPKELRMVGYLVVKAYPSRKAPSSQ